MSLDLIPLAGQLEDFVPRFRQALGIRERESERLRVALTSVGDGWQRLNDQRREQQRVFGEPRATFLEVPARTISAPSGLANYRVIATDGSQIALDRHQAAQCYVINVGKVTLQYGDRPAASLRHEPELRWSQEALPDEIDDEGGDADTLPPTAQACLELERAVAELRALRELASEGDPSVFTLALLDNSLVLWSPTMDVEKSAVRPLLDAYVAELEQLATLGRTRPLALAGYLSYPSSSWVADLLGASLEETDEATTTNGRGRRQATALFDRDLFGGLSPGARTARFARQSRLLQSYPDDCKVQFFYLNAGPEIARVELPSWVGNNPELLARTQAGILDQCRRNQGYPVALMEAHEQAVVSPSESRAFWEMVRRLLRAQGLPDAESAKSTSKRVPTA